VLLARAELGKQLQDLRLLQLELQQRGAGGTQDRVHTEQLAAATEHLDAAMAALLRAGTRQARCPIRTGPGTCGAPAAWSATAPTRPRGAAPDADPKVRGGRYCGRLFQMSMASSQGPYHLWTNGQAERLNRSVKDATVKAYHYATHADLETHVRAFVVAHNFAKHLTALHWRTPFQAICDAWPRDPQPFRIEAHHLIPGPRTWSERHPASHPARYIGPGESRTTRSKSLRESRHGPSPS
jgi:hypothetical protein